MNWLRKSNWNRWAHQDCGRCRGLGAPELQSWSGKWPEENVPVFRLPPCASYKHLKLFLRWWKDKSKMFYFFIFKIFFSFLFIYSSLIQCILTISFPPSTPPSSLPPTSVTRVGKLILKSWNWENWHCPPSAVALGRAASTPHLVRKSWPCLQDHRWADPDSMRADLTPHPFVYHVVAWVRKNAQLFCPLPAVAVERVDSGITGVGVLILSLNSLSTGERRPCTLSGQHTRADPIGGCSPCSVPHMPWGGKDEENISSPIQLAT